MTEDITPRYHENVARERAERAAGDEQARLRIELTSEQRDAIKRIAELCHVADERTIEAMRRLVEWFNANSRAIEESHAAMVAMQAEEHTHGRAAQKSPYDIGSKR